MWHQNCIFLLFLFCHVVTVLKPMFWQRLCHSHIMQGMAEIVKIHLCREMWANMSLLYSFRGRCLC